MGNYNKELISFQKDKRLNYIYNLNDVVVQADDIPKLKFSKYNYDDIIGQNMEVCGVYVRIPSDVNYATISYNDRSNDIFDFEFHTEDGVSGRKMPINSNEFMQQTMSNRLNAMGGTALTDTPKLLSDTFPQFIELHNHYETLMQNADFASLYTQSGQNKRVTHNTKPKFDVKKMVDAGVQLGQQIAIQQNGKDLD